MARSLKLSKSDKPDPGTALGLAEIARERRDRELAMALDNVCHENFLAEVLAGLTDDLPPLARAILDDRLTRPESARLARASPRYPVLELTAGTLAAHFRKMHSEVFGGA